MLNFWKKGLAITMMAALLLLGGCGEEEAPAEKPVERQAPAKEVEVFVPEDDTADLEFSKSGVAISDKVVYVSPQIAGRLTELKIEVGDTVKKGETLAILGESLNTDINQIQRGTAEQNLNIADQSFHYTWEVADNSIKTAQLNYQLAEEAYVNSLETQENAEKIYKTQRRQAEIAEDSADEYLDDLEDLLDDLEDDLDDVEEQLEDDPDDEDLLEEQASLEAQIDNTEDLIDSAEDSLESAELSVKLIDHNHRSQKDQLEFGTESAYTQYQLAANQLDTAYANAQLQELGAQSQLNQANSQAQISRLTEDSKYIKSPVSGNITSITAEEGNLLNPGQSIIKIENADNVVIKTSVNSYEAQLIRKGDKVEVATDSGDLLKGEVTSISGSADSNSKKISVEIAVTNPKKLTPESFVKVYFKISDKKRVFIPLNSVFTEDNVKKVSIVKNNKIKYIEVEIGEVIGNFVEITKGLKGNEQIVKAGTTFLEEDEQVKIKK